MTNTNFGAQRDKGTFIYVTSLDGIIPQAANTETNKPLLCYECYVRR